MDKYTLREIGLYVLDYTPSELAFKDANEIMDEAEEVDYHECEACEKWVAGTQYDEEKAWCDDCKTYIEN